MDNNELMHYGVLGMKWGRRKIRKSPDETPKKKSVKDMSDDELRKSIARLEMEKRYNDLSPKQVSKGKQFVSDFLNKAVVPAVNEAGKNLARDYITKIGKKKLGLDMKDKEQAYYDRLAKEIKQMNTVNTWKRLKKEFGE